MIKPKTIHKINKKTITAATPITKEENHALSGKKVIAIVISIFVGLALLVGFLSGAVQFGVAYAQCGHAPIIENSSPYFGGDSWYDVPSDSAYVQSLNVQSHFYCSEAEVQQRTGARINPLSDEGIKRRMQNDNIQKN